MPYALRHIPDKYGIALDEEEYMDLHKFLRAMNMMHHFKPKLTREYIQYVINHIDKKRLEMTSTKIRALYDHSVPVINHKTLAVPSDILYYGTAHRFLKNIWKEGLLPVIRQYVHFSKEQKTAWQVDLRQHRHSALQTR
jgi:putative RNA 2'-phosphotransferase